MKKRADEIINLRNEGMAYALKIAKERGIEELQRQVNIRGCLRVSVKFTPEELQQSIDNIAERVYNNMLTMVYAVLRDTQGYGKKRLTQFKKDFDAKVYEVGETDEMGHHWASFEDYALEANELFNLGINIDAVQQAQKNNDETKYISAVAAVNHLKEKGFDAAAEELRREVFDKYWG